MLCVMRTFHVHLSCETVCLLGDRVTVDGLRYVAVTEALSLSCWQMCSALRVVAVSVCAAEPCGHGGPPYFGGQGRPFRR